MVKHWQASAPANIAIVKYMGKSDASQNVALNPSLSMTLGKFRTSVEISVSHGQADTWEPLHGSDLPPKAGERFLRFFAKLKPQAIQQNFLLRSGNNFPSDCGLASSASSFAALTLAAEACFSELEERRPRPPERLAQISRTGSGSSCRSFFPPWCAWEGDTIRPVPHDFPALTDLVVILADAAKKVSSSEAHRRVQSSPLIIDRETRAQANQRQALEALRDGNFPLLAQVAWRELWEMHSMFHTAQPPFWYFTPASLEILRFVDDLWEKEGDGPIATVDAGPNVHLLVRLEQRERVQALLQEKMRQPLKILESGA